MKIHKASTVECVGGPMDGHRFELPEDRAHDGHRVRFPRFVRYPECFSLEGEHTYVLDQRDRELGVIFARYEP